MAGKIGMQFKRRFWEEDEMIYGGITYTNNLLYQIFYPSNDYLRASLISQFFDSTFHIS